MAAEAEEARAAIALRAELGVFGAPHAEDVRDGGDGLRVVDDGGSAIESDHRRKRRADARDAALAFEGLHQRRLFADFVGAGAGLGDDIEVEAGAEDVLAEEAFGIGLGDGALHDLEQVAVLAAQVDEAHFGLNGEAGDDRALDHRVRVLLENEAVFAGAGLGLIAVDENVLGLGRLLRHKGPLKPGGEACTAAAAQIRGFHLVDDAFRAKREGFARRLVAAQFNVAADIGCALAEAVRDDRDAVGMRGERRH